MSVVRSSFRDPAGVVFEHDGAIYRHIRPAGVRDYQSLMESGLYVRLVGEGMLVAHSEESVSPPASTDGLTIRPARIPFVSYPYEWSFSQLKDAALLTLQIQREAIQHGMSLKDASAFNIQFLNGRPILIDTLSLEMYREGQPWIAYRQFCQHFLAPLLLMGTVDVRLNCLLARFVDGVPLDLAARLVPYRTRASVGRLVHIHLHARSLRRHARTQINRLRTSPRMSRAGLLGMIDSLARTVADIDWQPGGSEWAEYENDNTYDPEARESKKAILRSYLGMIPQRDFIWDLGANAGEYSRVAASMARNVVAFDIDPSAVEKNYLRLRGAGETNILPLLLDLANPTGPVGWAGEERMSWLQRGPVDVILALALIHHLAIANSIPLERIAMLFSQLCRSLIIEFVPKSDPQTQRLLGSRADIFTDYSTQGFLNAFAGSFRVVREEPIPGSSRSVYLMERVGPC